MSIVYVICLLCAIILFAYFNYKDTIKKFESKKRSDRDESIKLKNE